MESINQAEKILIHISHLHPLRLVTSPEPRPVCHACHIQCSDQCYGCIECRYYLHITCATAKRYLDHPTHPNHTLNFELTPPYSNGTFGCDACGAEGHTFGYRCRECNYDLHLHCAALPHVVHHQSHCHPLYMVCENPNRNNCAGVPYAYCELCKGIVDISTWFFRCSICNFGGHVACFAPEAIKEFLPVASPTTAVVQTPELQGGTQPGNVATALENLQTVCAQARMQSLMTANQQIQLQQLQMGQSLMTTNSTLHNMWRPNFGNMKDSI